MVEQAGYMMLGYWLQQALRCICLIKDKPQRMLQGVPA
jgi:hypothetical protein